MCLRLFKARLRDSLYQAIDLFIKDYQLDIATVFKPDVIPVPVQPGKRYGLIDVHEPIEPIEDIVVDVEVDKLVKQLESCKNTVIVLKF